MLRQNHFLAFVLTTGIVAAFAVPAQGVFITEYFNSYGSTTQNPDGFNGGQGWSGGWLDTLTGSDDGDPPDTFYEATNLTHTATGYSNAGNNGGANDGASLS